MARPKSQHSVWIIVLSLLGVAVIAVMGLLAYLLLTLPASRAEAQNTPTPRPTLGLPTAPPPTPTPGPPPSLKVVFTAEKPLKGFANCTRYGVKGVVAAANGDRLGGVQITLWAEGVGLIKLSDTDAGGSYALEIEDKPARRKLWVQVYQNDLPVSDPLSVETELDCRKGRQIFQVNWREKSE
ncbi:MAG: hypothetical protein U0401_15610 [Anaerolineae bacterium]